MVYKWYILPIGWLYGTYHLLREPETAIDDPKRLPSNPIRDNMKRICTSQTCPLDHTADPYQLFVKGVLESFHNLGFSISGVCSKRSGWNFWEHHCLTKALHDGMIILSLSYHGWTAGPNIVYFPDVFWCPPPVNSYDFHLLLILYTWIFQICKTWAFSPEKNLPKGRNAMTCLHISGRSRYSKESYDFIPISSFKKRANWRFLFLSDSIEGMGFENTPKKRRWKWFSISRLFVIHIWSFICLSKPEKTF